MNDKLFQQYHKRIVKEGLIKSFLISFAIGAGVLMISALFSWFFGFKAGLWISLALFIVVTGGLIPVFYALKFRPTTKAIAKRVDELGLEERVLTMTGLENDSSYMAMRQREDTKQALGTVNHMLIKIVVSVALIVTVAVVGVFGIGFFTVDSLYVAGVIPSGIELLSETVGVKMYRVSYSSELSDAALAAFKAEGTPAPESGFGDVYYYDEENWTSMDAFEGELELKGGEDAPAVIAIPARGYVFLQWSDGSRDPFRRDNITKDISLVAIFEQIEGIDVEDPELREPQPQDPAPGEGEGNEGGDPTQDQEPGEGSESAGGNRNSANNMIQDGETNFGDEFSDAHDQAQGRLESDGELSDAQKGWANGYFDSIEGGN